jgi:hypothetical protein
MLGRRLLLLVCAALLVAFVHPTAATAARERVEPVALTGVCPWLEGESKVVTTVMLGRSPFTPLFLFDEKGTTWTRSILLPYEVTVDGDGLKSRHLLPGETYTRSGPAPSHPVTCTFGGQTADGDVGLEVVGSVVVLPRPRR